MKSECDEFRDRIAESDLADDARLLRHTARCSTCREQLTIDRELRRRFREVSRPSPSIHFDRVLKERLRAERQRQRRYRWRLLVMQGYWAAAALGSAIVMTMIPWPSEFPSPPVLFVIGAACGMAVLAPVILFLSSRVGPLDLLVGTVQAFRR